jgi:hypothetical protein
MVVDWGCLSSVVVVARRGRCESRIATSVIVCDPGHSFCCTEGFSIVRFPFVIRR